LKPHGVSLFDSRPFFEKALVYGVQNGILDPSRLDSIRNDAPKGMVQIARYFGTEFLRPELEKARDRMVNLVSLYLEDTSGGDLRRAAESLRDHSFLSRSKGGSDMLKALIAMPQNSHFGMHESGGFTDEQIPLLAKWSLRTLPEYQAELALRSQISLLVEAAVWFAEALGKDVSDLEEAGKDAEAVIRTGLLTLATRRKDMPDWVAFEKMILALRKKYRSEPGNASTLADSGADLPGISLPKDLPEHFQKVVEGVRQSLLADLPRILDPGLAPRKLFDQTPAFIGRYFWLEDALGEADHYQRAVSATWDKATSGHGDDSSLLTLFLCLAAGSTPKTLLSEKAAITLIRKIRKSGLQVPLAQQFIRNHAPHNHQSGYLDLWESFVAQALPTLQSDFDYALKDALALLRCECNIGP
jgi:hypothetical protein